MCLEFSLSKNKTLFMCVLKRQPKYQRVKKKKKKEQDIKKMKTKTVDTMQTRLQVAVSSNFISSVQFSYPGTGVQDCACSLTSCCSDKQQIPVFVLYLSNLGGYGLLFIIPSLMDPRSCQNFSLFSFLLVSVASQLPSSLHAETGSANLERLKELIH